MKTAKADPTSPQWEATAVPLAEIIKHPPWQVRVKLDERAVKRYEDMSRAGMEPPPIKVARVGKKLYLIDGWHRMEAGALRINPGLHAGPEVDVLLADLTRQEAIWEAAKANLNHGVQYKSKELHGVFKAFIKAKKHIKPDGRYMSYREMAPHIGKGHTTLRAWMFKYFRSIAHEIGGTEEGNPEASQPPNPDWEEEHKNAALESLEAVVQRLDLLTPEARWLIVQRLEEARTEALTLGVLKPPPEDF